MPKPDDAVVEAHRTLVERAAQQLANIKVTLASLANTSPDNAQKLAIEGYIQHAERQIDQVVRRVIKGETIPHAEKVFSIFEPHTEWVSKGKVGVPVEFGMRVCIMEDQYRFILHHRVMSKETDDKVAVSMVADTKAKFPDFNACSFDKGFHSPANQSALKEQLEQVTLPRKGKLSQQAKAAERTEAFVQARPAHSAVESAINALEVHGLDKCPDHGLHGFKRYVALWQRDAEREQRRKAALLGRARKKSRLTA